MVSGLESSEVARNNADPLEVKLAGEVQKLLLPKGLSFVSLVLHGGQKSYGQCPRR